MHSQSKKQKVFKLSNTFFLVLDIIIVITAITLLILNNKNICFVGTCLIYIFFQLAQIIQHYCIYKFPLIDINKHHVAYRRTLISVCIVDLAYMLMCLTFWQRTPDHPLYCLLCTQWNISSWIGLVLILHWLVILSWGINFIHAYVSRRYYLLALGGFEVEQRIIQERRRQLEQIMIRQPDTNFYPNNLWKPKDKYYKFEDVIETEQENYQCSICLNKKVDQDHFVNAGCGHYYHQICLLQWAQVNENCPQCRANFKQQEVEKELQMSSQKKSQKQSLNNEESLNHQNNYFEIQMTRVEAGIKDQVDKNAQRMDKKQ